jgi:hypothetical protein
MTTVQTSQSQSQPSLRIEKEDITFVCLECGDLWPDYGTLEIHWAESQHGPNNAQAEAMFEEEIAQWRADGNDEPNDGELTLVG